VLEVLRQRTGLDFEDPTAYQTAKDTATYPRKQTDLKAKLPVQKHADHVIKLF